MMEMVPLSRFPSFLLHSLTFYAKNYPWATFLLAASYPAILTPQGGAQVVRFFGRNSMTLASQSAGVTL